MLKVTRQGFYKYLANKDRPWKYQDLADAIRAIVSEDECNDTYGRIRMYQALLLKQPESVHIPDKRTVYRIMKEIELNHHAKRKPNGITKTDREARKSDDLLKQDFKSAEPLKKCVTDITEIKTKYGISQSMNSAGGQCHDNARCESMWARMKEELLSNRYDT